MAYDLSAWRCYNWHNLLFQDHQVRRGDIFALGPSESGKTTLLDSVALVLTGDHEELQWNAAANPALAKTTLRERGRSLLDILLRKHEHVARNERGLGYFLMELHDKNSGRYVTLGCGGSVRSKQSEHVEKWWILANGKRIGDLRFTDAAGDVLPKQEFKDANPGTVLDTGRYRVQVTRLLFPALVNNSDDEVRSSLEKWVHYLNIAKAYGRLEKQDLSELVRAALPAPDPTAFRDAKEGTREMRRINTDIQRAQDHLGSLTNMQSHVEAAKGHEIHLRANKYQASRVQHGSLKTQLTDAEGRLTTYNNDKEAASNKEQRLTPLLRELEKQIKEIEEPEAKRLLRQAEDLEHEQETLGLDAEAKKTAATDAGDQTERAAKLVETERKALDEARLQLLGQILVLEKTAAPWKPVIDALNAVTSALKAEDDTAAVGHQARVGREAHDIAENIVREVETKNGQVGDLDSRLDLLTAEQAKIVAQRDVPPVEGLDEILREVSGARAVYQCLEAEGPEAALLQEFLPRHVLGAIIPGSKQTVESVRSRVHRIRNDILVVDPSDLPENLELQGALACLDKEKSDPIALRYLFANYGDVRLLQAGEAAPPSGRAIWRSGDVLDGHAWHVAPDAPLVFLNQRARADARQARLQSIARDVEIISQERGKLRAALEELERRKRILRELVNDGDRAFRSAQLVERQGNVSILQERHKGLEAIARAKQGTYQEVATKLAAIVEAYQQLQKTIAAKGVKELAARQAALQTKASGYRVELTAATEARIRNDQDAKRQNQACDLLKEQLRAAENAMGLARDNLVLISGMSPVQIEAFLREKNIKPDLGSIESSMARQTGLRSDAMAQARLIRNDLARRNHDLEFVEDQYLVRESRTRKPLGDIIHELDLETSENRKKAVMRLEEILKTQVLKPIGGRLKDDLNALDRLITSLSQHMKTTPFNGRHYKLRKITTEDKAPMVKLIEEYSDLHQDPLKNALMRILGDESKDVPQIEAFFDYRQWFTFKLERQTGVVDINGAEEYLEASSPKSSGGGQAAPHYVLAFAMLKMFYQTTNAQLPIVLLDEAFRGVDSANQLVLYEMAVGLRLTTIAANTDFTGHATLHKTADVFMFRKDPTSHDTFIWPYSQEFEVPHASR